jgi:Zn-dependent metalloprotease
MCISRNPIHCIVSPRILDAMLASKDAKVRKSALETIKLSSFIRGRRSVLRHFHTSLVAAQSSGLKRSIFDSAGQETDPPTGDLVRKEGGPATDDEAVTEAYDGLGATYTFYDDVFQRDSIDGQGMALNAYVHFAQGFNNAFWDGAEMVFGDGDGIVFVRFTKSLDVIGHELTHGVTEHTAGLDYHKQPGALNESMSDVFGSLIKQYHLSQSAADADWLIGAELLAPGVSGKALRSMADPGSAFDDPRLGGKDPQPKTMDDYLDLPDTRPGDWGGVHENSGIPNHAFYLAATALGGNAWEDAGHIWYNALLQLSPQSQFQDCANITAQVAASLFGTNSNQQKAVMAAWAEVGLGVAPPQAAPVTAKKTPAAGKKEPDLAALKALLERTAHELQRVDGLIH